MKKNADEFTMKDYGRKAPFASFLPGIAGLKGIPVWCYYVNRGQGVASFGVDNKDHAIMEFYPAHQAYQNVKTTGFRTFIRKDGTVWEAFAKEHAGQEMHIFKNCLELTENSLEMELGAHVSYFVLPGEKFGALVRSVGITNQGSQKTELEILDGMPAVIPYGVSMESMKNMGQTSKAWMQAEDVKEKRPYFRVRASMDDTAAVRKIEGGNFGIGFLEDGSRLPVIADPSLIFSYETSMQHPAGFEEHTLEELFEKEQITTNELPCCFFGMRKELEPGESVTFYELAGQVENKKLLDGFLSEKRDAFYFRAKKEEAWELTEELCKGIETHTASEEFDIYCQYTYMDNVLRGGYPIRLGSNKIFYVYSRKHGDLERDYNYFSMLPEFYSQGSGNFRDVNQNRRCDTFFAPYVGRENIHAFYSLLQLDGYNPLSVGKVTYRLAEKKAEKLFEDCPENMKEELTAFAEKGFTPGALYRKLTELSESEPEERLFYQILDFSERMPDGDFGEGYWSDHWTYNLDLIRDYLEIFPDKEKEMLYEEAYTTFASCVNVNRREKRYVETENGLRQYQALDLSGKRENAEKLVRTEYGQGEPLYMTLLEKLVLLCTVKYATLDPYGMGIEMEGGKPGWYDALNGMPGLFGSSMAETCELKRMLDYTIGALQKYPGEIRLIEEAASLLEELQLITGLERESIFKEQELLSFWNRINDAKEIYRDKTYQGISGKKRKFASDTLAEALKKWQEAVEQGIRKACRYGNGICPTYFTYEVPEYEVSGDGIKPLKFKVKQLPYFLEGPVRYLKLPYGQEEKRTLYENVKNSGLYDEKLHMYKVNDSLENASYELGRAKVFTPGWLENESIWLHMEYKYLLELLKSGLYEEFFRDFKNAAIPFLDPEVYGRSIYENSSFLCSSRNPNRAYHGKGFVARLSGSTIEFISMWKYMMFGQQLFGMKEGILVFAPCPALPEYLIPESGEVSAMMLGDVKVCYRCADKRDYLPGNYQIAGMSLTYKNGTHAEVTGQTVSGKMAEDIRNHKVEQIIIALKK